MALRKDISPSDSTLKETDMSTQARKVFFISDSTGITAETLGNTLLTQFPESRFERETIPFVTSPEYAGRIVARIDDRIRFEPKPLIFSTVISPEIRAVLGRTKSTLIDLMGEQIGVLEHELGQEASRTPGRAHGQGDVERYQARMQAVEYAIEHDDGQSLRALDQADIILIAPSRCGKTPTTMYLALQHAVFVANYPLIEEDFDSTELPKPIRAHAKKCFGILSNPKRLSEVRYERRPNSRYASLEQCAFELRNAESLYNLHNIPYMNSASKSVEEMSTVIMHKMKLRQ